MIDVPKLGLIVNPIAGLGGRVGLKGTDGRDIVEKALQLGALPLAPRRAIEALENLGPQADRVEILTYPGDMGERQARACGFSPTLVGGIEGLATGASDTRRAAAQILHRGADLLLFAGGDGTARCVLEAVGDEMVVLGIPAGVKMHSAIYAPHPARAGELAAQYLFSGTRRVMEVEVMDIDEPAFRRGRMRAALYGYLVTPYDARYLQVSKAGSAETEESAHGSIAAEVVENMRDDGTYLVGPGTTTRAVLRQLGVEGTLLGVDVVRGGEMVGRDLGEGELLEHMGDAPGLIVAPVGGQGFLLGRGNQQLSPSVVRRVGRDAIIVVATHRKLHALRGRPLLVDTGDRDVDRMLSGYMNVVTGYRDRVVYPVAF